jgi:hypothetical protein
MIQNVLVHAVNATRAAADVVFDPVNASAPGVRLYFLPFSHEHTLTNGGNITAQYSMAAARRPCGGHGCADSSNGSTVDPAWRTAALTAFAALPQLSAPPVYEGRTEFDQFGPLEWAATATEVAALLAAAGSRSVLPFLEPRERPILYLSAVPHAWAARGPDWHGGVFRGARKDEHFMLQIGLVTSDRGFLLEHSGCVFSDLALANDGSRDNNDVASAAAIPASALSSPNLGGFGSRGQRFTRAMNVSGGRNGVLWVAVAIPPTAAAGNYTGTVRLTLQLHSDAVSPPQQVIALPLTVEVLAGAPVVAHGDLDGASLSRSRWLDSTEGIDDVPTERFGALSLDRGSGAVRTGKGCEVVIDAATGLPRSVGSNTAQYGELLAGAMRFEAVAASGETLAVSQHAAAGLQWTVTDSVVSWTAPVQYMGTGRDLQLALAGSMEFDGALYFNATLTNVGGSDALALEDVQLSLPIRAEAAPYVMGMGTQGGYSDRLHEHPIAWRWSIDPVHLVRNNQVWLGDPGLGLRLKLLPKGIEFDSGEYWVDEHTIPTASWAGAKGPTVSYPFTSLHFNRTTYAGGANISYARDNQTLNTVVYSGPKLLPKGGSASFRFQLLVTPSRPPDASAHFEQKYLQIGSPTPAPGGTCDTACAEAFVQENVVDPGYTIMNLHHGTFPLNPYLNWPLAPDAVHAQTVIAEILHRLHYRLKVYFTVGQVSDHIEIIALLRSLDGEVLDLCDNTNSEHPTNNEESDTGLCTTKASRETYSYTHPGGYAWVQEHLGSGYVPTWTQPIGLRNGMGPAETYTGNVDQSLKDAQEQPNQLARRMENYMVGGLKHMLENPPHIDGL